MPNTDHITIALKGTSACFTDDCTRKSLPCSQCKKPTTGRTNRKAACMDCFFKGLLQMFREAA